MRALTLMYYRESGEPYYRGSLLADHGRSQRTIGREMWECNHKHRTNNGAQRCAKYKLGLMESMVDHFLKRLPTGQQ